MAVAAAGGRILVANAEDSTVTLIDPAGGAASFRCDCTIAGLERVSGKALFRVTGPDDRPIWLFDAGGAEPQFWFVPVSEEVAQ